MLDVAISQPISHHVRQGFFDSSVDLQVSIPGSGWNLLQRSSKSTHLIRPVALLSISRLTRDQNPNLKASRAT